MEIGILDLVDVHFEPIATYFRAYTTYFPQHTTNFPKLTTFHGNYLEVPPNLEYLLRIFNHLRHLFHILSVIGFLGFIVFIIMAIVSAIKKTGKGKKRVLAAVGFFVLMIIGAAISPTAKETPDSTNTATKKTEDPAKQKADEEKKADQEAKKKAQAEEAAKKKAEDEALAKKKAEEEAKKIKPGIYEVNKDIQPGLYKSYGSIGYWARLSGFSGDLNEILANGNPQGSDLVEILSSDKAFQTEGSGYWLKIDETYQPEILTSFGDGTYIVGKDIAPGRYKSETDNGYWARLKGFSGDLNNILANANPTGPTIVEIKPTDKGFQTWNNGTWTKMQ